MVKTPVVMESNGGIISLRATVIINRNLSDSMRGDKHQNIIGVPCSSLVSMDCRLARLTAAILNSDR